ncbi:MAG: hypothetical protein JNL11_17480 [Bdellovibrionaceae bacterium]|nr:hypothetical protein [Pseudobdellovibrionaceae bacterium]
MSTEIVSNQDQTPNKSIPAAVDTEIEATQSVPNEDEITEELGDENEPESDDSKSKEQLSKGLKKRLAVLTKTRAEAKLSAQREKERADYYEQKFRESQAPKQTESQTKSDAPTNDEPNPDDFETNASYIRAMVKWEAETAKKIEKEASRKDQEKSAQQKAYEAHNARVEAFKKETPDFDEAIESVEDIELKPALMKEIASSDVSEKLMYKLSKDRDLLEKINALPDSKIVKEIAILEFQLSKDSQAKAETKTSKAPAPITPIGAKGSGVIAKSLNDPNISFAEYERIRMQELKNKK